MRWLQRGLRLLAVVVSVALPLGLFYGGAQPIAVGLRHQAYLPGREAGWDDLAADLVGSTLGATALLWRARVKHWLKQKVVNHH